MIGKLSDSSLRRFELKHLVVKLKEYVKVNEFVVDFLATTMEEIKKQGKIDAVEITGN